MKREIDCDAVNKLEIILRNSRPLIKGDRETTGYLFFTQPPNPSLSFSPPFSIQYVYPLPTPAGRTKRVPCK